MNWISGSGRLAMAIAVTAVLGLSSASHAQEPSKAKVEAARAAIAALHATDDFDGILPNAAESLKRSLIQADPNLEKQISDTVDAQAIELAKRRADLENEVATIYAKSFTSDELDAITKFYSSEAGKKLLNEGGDVTRQTLQAARIWSNGIARDLADATHKALEAKLGKDVKVTQPSISPKKN